MSSSSRPGYVLLAVLWIMAALAVSSLGMTALARRYVGRARNGQSETQAAWIAEGCIAEAHAAIDGVLVPMRSAAAVTPASWTTLDRALAGALWQPPSACLLTMQPTGLTLDLNTVDRATLSRLFVALATATARADSLSDAIVDWRDAAGQQRTPDIADSRYARHGPLAPRHGPFADIHELLGIHGIDSLNGLDSVLGVDHSRILLDAAPLTVIRALPGFTTQAAARVAGDRVRGTPIPDLIHFAGELDADARDSLLAHYADLVRLTTRAPDAWMLTAQASVGDPQVTVIVEARLVPSATGAAVSVRRTWIQ